jgi:Ca2+-binding RTX toxin-like protein
MMQELESRRLMSATLGTDGTVRVNGTDGPDTINVDLALYGAYVAVRETGVVVGAPPAVSYFVAGNVKRIEVNAYGGADTVRISTAITLPTRVDGGAGDDLLSGGSGNDYLFGGSPVGGLLYGGGNDILFGNDGDDFVDGGNGAGVDLLDGGYGADQLLSSGGTGIVTYADRREDLVIDLRGNGMTHSGAAGENDYIYSSIHDVIGGHGNDLIIGSDGADYLWGGDGNDSITGGAGDDELRGGAGDDTVTGGVGADVLYGQDGNDILDARDGGYADVVSGGAGFDVALVDAGFEGMGWYWSYRTDTVFDAEWMLPA